MAKARLKARLDLRFSLQRFFDFYSLENLNLFYKPNTIDIGLKSANFIIRGRDGKRRTVPTMYKY